MSLQRTIVQQYYTDHAARKLLPWVDGLLDESERHYSEHGKPLFSSPMIDLSEEDIDNISTVKNTLREFKIDMTQKLNLVSQEAKMG